MGFGDTLKTMAKATMMNNGKIGGSAWPVGSFINIKKDENNNNYIVVTKPDNSEESITHDMIQCATVLAMGAVDVDSRTNNYVQGVKYLCMLKDGRQAIITVPFQANGDRQYIVENVLF